MSRAHHGHSLRDFFLAREFMWKGRRIQSQLGTYEPKDRLPQVVAKFEKLMADIAARFAGMKQA